MAAETTATPLVILSLLGQPVPSTLAGTPLAGLARGERV